MAATPAPLVAKLQEVLATKEELLVAYLLDGSTSMRDSFEKLREALMVLLDRVGPNVMTEVLQFSTTTQVVCPWTKNLDQIKRSCQKPIPRTLDSAGQPGMALLGGGTNMKMAFEELSVSFMRVVTEASRPVVVFITDGMPNDDPQKEINRFLRMTPRPTVIGVGVGSGTSQEKLEKLLPNQPVFMVADFAKLVTMLSSMANPEPQPEPPEYFRLSFFPADRVQSPQEPLRLRFNLEPGLDSKDGKLPSSIKIRFLASKYYFGAEVQTTQEATEDNPVSGEVLLKITNEGKNGHAALPELLAYRMDIPGYGKYNGTVSFRLAWLVNDLLKTDPFNILIVGPMGSGKTSLLNGFANLFGMNEHLQNFHMSYASDTHVTKDYKCIPLAHHIDENDDVGYFVANGLKIRMWDSWGITDSTYKSIPIPAFLRGQVWDGTAMPANEGASSTQMMREPDPNSVIHAVLFVLPIGYALAEGQLKSLSAHVKAVLERDIRPVLVVTFAGTVKDEAELRRSFEEILRATGLHSGDVFLIDNYTNEALRNMQKDMKYWDILNKVIFECQRNWMRFAEQKLPHPTGAPMPGMSVEKQTNLKRRGSPPQQPAPQAPQQHRMDSPVAQRVAHVTEPTVGAAAPPSPVPFISGPTAIPEVALVDRDSETTIVGSVMDIRPDQNLRSLREEAAVQGVGLDDYKFLGPTGGVIADEGTESRTLVQQCLDKTGTKILLMRSAIQDVRVVSTKGKELGMILDVQTTASLTAVRMALAENGINIQGDFAFVGIDGRPVPPEKERSTAASTVLAHSPQKKGAFQIAVMCAEAPELLVTNDTTHQSYRIPLPAPPDRCTVGQLRQLVTSAGIATGAFVFVSKTNTVGYTLQQERLPALTVKRITSDDGAVHFKAV